MVERHEDAPRAYPAKDYVRLKAAPVVRRRPSRRHKRLRTWYCQLHRMFMTFGVGSSTRYFFAIMFISMRVQERDGRGTGVHIPMNDLVGSGYGFGPWRFAAARAASFPMGTCCHGSWKGPPSTWDAKSRGGCGSARAPSGRSDAGSPSDSPPTSGGRSRSRRSRRPNRRLRGSLQTLGAFAAVAASEKIGRDRQQDRRQNAVETHAEARKRPSGFADLQRPGRADAVRSDSHGQPDSARIADAQLTRRDGADDGAGDPGHDDEHGGQRRRPADFFPISRWRCRPLSTLAQATEALRDRHGRARRSRLR